ncbi:MAG: UDP-N-acetylmuramoyl-L-alanyl-D-glutamate--2,6-diaminopimelate ligase [Clostridia bacterium]|nr:UDP-N-acetylmuramoyl-L-alanyl-D-glutamate--2,6-diaminopimelate ligase [Clostridia bacterium]
MKLSQLLSGIETTKILNFKDLEIEDIDNDSREVFSRSLFFALKGNNLDGNRFVLDAVKRGAVAVISDTANDSVKVPQIIVKDVKKVMAEIAMRFYKPNGNRVKVIGVVGTNGKTTTTFILKSILEQAGYKAGVIGTLGAFYKNAVVEPDLTTPDSINFYKILKDMADSGVEYAVVELSAHAIAQKRTGSLKFEGLIFTNCTQDHLDYFKDFNEYESVKASVFDSHYSNFAVVNSDDATGIKILNNNKIKSFSYGIENPSDVFAVNILNSKNGINFVMNLFDDIVDVYYSSSGMFNVYNCLGAATFASILGISSSDIASGIKNVKKVAGRMEFVENFNGADIYVDYAHTPDGLENLLKSLRQITKNNLYLVFGCGGNRDTSKRPIMGEIAGKYADFTVITSDNPRFEDAYQIISDIESGFRKSSLAYITIQNREMAIGYALSKIGEGDVLVVSGKGAENYQEIMGVKLKYSDIETIKELIAKIKFSGDII